MEDIILMKYEYLIYVPSPYYLSNNYKSCCDFLILNTNLKKLIYKIHLSPLIRLSILITP